MDFESHLALATPTIVEAIGSIDGRPLKNPWRRQIPKDGVRTTSSAADVGEIRNIASEKYRRVNDLGIIETDNPIIAFFGTSRLHGNAKNTMGVYKGREVFKYGYYSWSDMKFGSYQYLNWLRSFTYLIQERKESEETRLAFFETLKTAIPYIKDVDFDGNELRIRTQIEDEVSQYLPLSLHSDGVITHTSLVAELAFRCIVLNSHYGAQSIERSRGVTMIDEMDLHIHPVWQRHIVSDLKKAFPMIQFVVTTHSPFIVQSLSANELINLDKDTDYNPNELSIKEVAEDVMGVSSQMSVENEAQEVSVDDYLKKLEEYKHSDEANEEFEAIESEISDPGLRAFLQMNKLRKEYESNK